jgi:8-oxo-dGTP pyrophosphatase MutT (NUDIX family)
MAISEYLRDLRRSIGTKLVLMPCVTAVIHDDSGRLLVARHAGSGIWGTPGGAIDPNEAPATAVVREVREETGLEIRALGVIGAWGGPEFLVTYENGDQCSYVMIAYQCEIIGGEMCPDGEEVLELRYVDAVELGHLSLSPWGRLVLPQFFALASPTRGRP